MPAKQGRSADPSSLRLLTQREGEILSLLAQGLTNAEIAGRLSMALSSIKWYTQQIYGKLEVHSRREAAARARELGLDGPAESAPAPGQLRAGRDGRPANLPVPLSSFIGRQNEKAEIKQLLHSAPVRLLTLSGPAGCGKTRLALEAAAELVPAFQERVWWVDLTSLADAALLPQAVASALGVREQPGQTSLDALVDRLHPKPALLVLDNCEHLLTACAALGQALLAACPQLKVLATSREALAVAGETTWPVPTLSLPASDWLPVDKLLEAEAVRLFAERARAALPTFALTEHNGASAAQVCRRLDGIPLAIELAAARVRVLTTAQIAERLDDALGLLTRGSPLAAQRHETLRAALDWSHYLLSDRERALLRRLSTFAGGFALEAAEAICAGAPLGPSQLLDVLSDLADHSLVVVESPQGGSRRFRLLEVIHQYADEKLKAAGEFEALHDRHLAWFLQLAEQAQPEFLGPRLAAWMARLEQERGNLRAALAWSLDQPERVEPGIKMASALAQFWQLRGELAEGLAWLDRLLARSAEVPLLIRAGLLEAKGFLMTTRGSSGEAQAVVGQAMNLFQEAGDLRGVGRQLIYLAFAAQDRDDTAQAIDFASRSLEIYRAAGDKWWTSASLFALGDTAVMQGDVARATECYQESLALCQELGHAFCIARRLVRLGHVARIQGDFTQARAHLLESLALAHQVSDNWCVTMALAGVGSLALAQDQPERAARLLGAAQARLEAFGAHFWSLDRVESGRAVAGVRAMIGPEAFTRAWDEGRAMTAEQAMDYAVEARAAVTHPSSLMKTGASGRPAGLTRREAEILRLIAAGESNRAIADELVLSVRTVERHIANIYQKIGASGPAARTAAASFAFRHGLGPTPPR